MDVHLTSDQIKNIEEEVFAENKIQAIRLCREYTGWGLKESKNYVEKLIDDLIEKDSEKYGHLLKQGRSGCLAVLLLFFSSVPVIYILFK